MSASQGGYTAIGVFWPDRPEHPEFLAVQGKIVLFDTPDIARQTVPRLGGGRPESWDAARETVSFAAHPGAFSRLALYTGYDPYDVPNGFRRLGVRSEAHGLDWRFHSYWRHVLEVLIAWGDGLATGGGQHEPI